MRANRLLPLLLVSLLSVGWTLPRCTAQSWLPQQRFEDQWEGDQWESEDEDLAVEPGQLGRHYLELQYLQLDLPEESMSVGDPMRGFSFTFNVPARWNDRLPSFMGQDVFLTTQGLYGSGFDSEELAAVDLEFRSFSSGLSTYVFVTENFRPFVQLGISTQMLQADVSFAGTTIPLGNLDTSFFVNPGFELDFGERVAWRNLLETKSHASDNDTLLRTELIFWPGSRWFLKGGLAGNLQDDSWGFLLGGGYSW